MKPYAFALILVRFISLALAIYSSVCITTVYFTFRQLSSELDSQAGKISSISQSMGMVWGGMLVGSVVLFLIAPLLAKLLSMGTDRE